MHEYRYERNLPVQILDTFKTKNVVIFAAWHCGPFSDFYNLAWTANSWLETSTTTTIATYPPTKKKTPSRHVRLSAIDDQIKIIEVEVRVPC